MKFSEMTYTRPDINALLARCKQLAAKAADAQDGDALIQVYYEQSRAFADYTPPPSWPTSTTPVTPAMPTGKLSRTFLMPTAPL